MATIERASRFYITLVTIQVENCLFRIPRQSLESKSRIFRDMFSLPVTENTEGTTDDNPIRLDGITKREFERFLEVLFMNAFEPMETPDDFDMWFPVMKLAQMWEFDSVHKYAIRNMTYNRVAKKPAEKVALAVQYNIHSWLIPGLNELAQRKEPLGIDDLALLGPELLLKVAAVRESLAATTTVTGNQWDHYNRSNVNARLISGLRDASTIDFTSVIKRVFGIADDGTKIIPPIASR